MLKDAPKREKPKRPRNKPPREDALAMGMLAWVMMGLAIWHFAIFLPDRFWGGIVGAFLGALIGAVVFGLDRQRLHDPRRSDDTHLLTALEAIPGALIGIAAVYFEGVRRETRRRAAAASQRASHRRRRRRGSVGSVAAPCLASAGVLTPRLDDPAVRRRRRRCALRARARA